jgi:multidrug efflux pump subunit AcrB
MVIYLIFLIINLVLLSTTSVNIFPFDQSGYITVVIITTTTAAAAAINTRLQIFHNF